jgi:CheY-like chemotaxis protein
VLGCIEPQTVTTQANTPDHSAKILVVEDDDSIRKLVITALRRHHFNPEGVGDGESALARLREEHYAVIVLDLMMPRMTGWQLLDALRELPQKTVPPVVVMTAVAETTKLDPYLVKSVIRKPFDVELLCDVVSGCMPDPLADATV